MRLALMPIGGFTDRIRDRLAFASRAPIDWLRKPPYEVALTPVPAAPRHPNRHPRPARVKWRAVAAWARSESVPVPCHLGPYWQAPTTGARIPCSGDDS